MNEPNQLCTPTLCGDTQNFPTSDSNSKDALCGNSLFHVKHLTLPSRPTSPIGVRGVPRGTSRLYALSHGVV